MGFLSRLLGRPSEDEFARMFLNELGTRGLTGTYDPESFRIRGSADADRPLRTRTVSRPCR